MERRTNSQTGAVRAFDSEAICAEEKENWRERSGFGSVVVEARMS